MSKAGFEPTIVLPLQLVNAIFILIKEEKIPPLFLLARNRRELLKHAIDNLIRSPTGGLLS